MGANQGPTSVHSGLLPQDQASAFQQKALISEKEHLLLSAPILAG